MQSVLKMETSVLCFEPISDSLLLKRKLGVSDYAWLSGNATGPSRKTGFRHDYAMGRNDGHTDDCQI